jgi:hypothetical protein
MCGGDRERPLDRGDANSTDGGVGQNAARAISATVAVAPSSRGTSNWDLALTGPQKLLSTKKGLG